MSIQALVDKLVRTPSTSNKLEFSGPGFDKSKSNLQERLPSIQEPTLIALAAFLRHVNLDTFTDSELTLLASIDFTSIDKEIYSSPKNFKFGNESYYDIDSFVTKPLSNNFLNTNLRIVETNDFNSLLYLNKNTNLTYLAVLLSELL